MTSEAVDYCDPMDAEIKAKIKNLVVFMCNECGQGAANTAGVARMGYDAADSNSTCSMFRASRAHSNNGCP